MDIHDNTFTIFELDDILYEIAKTSGGEIAFKHGPVKRLFITSECREAGVCSSVYVSWNNNPSV